MSPRLSGAELAQMLREEMEQDGTLTAKAAEKLDALAALAGREEESDERSSRTE